MSIFPDFTERKRAAGGPPNKSADDEKEQDHRFDKFARRMGETMIEAIRVTLSVFSSPDKERWPATKLLDYLKSAEELARDMLREIAEKIFIAPAKFREQSRQGAFFLADNRQKYAPYFRLGVKREKEKLDENTSHRHPQTCSADLSPQGAQLDDGGPGLAQSANRDDDTLNESLFSRRLTALQDVLTHPGKHAARMARAIYRQAHEDGARLIAKSPNDVLLDKINLALAAYKQGDGERLTDLHHQVMKKWEPG